MENYCYIVIASATSPGLPKQFTVAVNGRKWSYSF
jgi:hypothetical protein